MKKMMMTLAVAGVFGAGVSMAEEAAAPAAAPQLPMMVPEAEAPKAFDWADVPAVVGKVGDREITRDEFKKFVLASLPGGEIPAAIPAPQVMMLLGNMASRMMSWEVVMAALKANDMPPAAQLVREAIEKEMSKATKEELDDMNEQLAAQNKDMSTFLTELSNHPMAQLDIASQALVEKLGADVKAATPEEAKKFYEENIANFTTEGSVEVAHILMVPAKDGSDDAAVKAKMDELLVEARKNPATFGDMARANSACPSKEKGGELGMKLTKDSIAEIDGDFLNAALPLKEGEISEVIKTQFGYHIIKCVAATEEVVEPYTPELETEIVEGLTERAKMEAASEYLKKLEETLKPEVFLKAPAMPQMQMMQ